MSTITELLQSMVNKNYDEVVSLGKIALNKLFPYLQQHDEEHGGFSLLTTVVLSAVGADGKLSAAEHHFLKDVLGLSEDGIQSLLSLYDPDMQHATDALYDNAPEDIRSHLRMFVVCILAVDERITREETAFLKMLFA